MSSFSPRLNPRPEPLKTTDVFLRWAENNVKAAAFSATFAWLTTPLFFYIVSAWPYSERMLFVAMSVLIHEVMYFGMNGFFYIAGKKKWFQKYRIHRGSYEEEPSEELLWKTIKDALGNHLLSQPLMAYFIMYPIMTRLGSTFSSPAPSWLYVFFSYLVFQLILDITFYWAHRAFHHKSLYKYHKQHHEYRGTIGFAAEYAHGIEQIFANSLPTILAPVLMGTHFHVWFVWLACRLSETYSSHSGFAFKGSWCEKIGFLQSLRALFHDFHHSRNSGNFGSELSDHLFGTCDLWVDYQRKLASGMTEDQAIDSAKGSKEIVSK